MVKNVFNFLSECWAVVHYILLLLYEFYFLSVFRELCRLVPTSPGWFLLVLTSSNQCVYDTVEQWCVVSVYTFASSAKAHIQN